MSNGIARKKGKKNRCHGRNKAWCQAYRARGQREKNKKARLKVRLEKHPNDRTARSAFDRI